MAEAHGLEEQVKDYEPSDKMLDLAVESFSLVWATIDALNARATSVLGFFATFMGLSFVAQRLIAPDPAWLFRLGVAFLLAAALVAGISWAPFTVTGLCPPKKLLAYERKHGWRETKVNLLEDGIEYGYGKALRAVVIKGKLMIATHWAGLFGILLVAFSFLR